MTNSERIAQALIAIETGFPSLAAKKRTISSLSFVYDEISREYRSILNRMEEEDALTRERFEVLYWELPMSYHLLRQHHINSVASINAEIADRFEALAGVMESIKATEIVGVVHTHSPVETRLRAKIANALKSQVTARIDYSQDFAGMAVTATAHIVDGANGTQFQRVFFFLDGEITALHKIIALAEEHERRTK